MKKVLSFILVLVILISSFSVYSSAVENEVAVMLNGFEVIFDVPGRLIGDRTMVPLRKIGEALGAGVEWIPETSGIKLTRGSDEIMLAIGSYDLYKNGQLSYTMDIAPVIIEEAGQSRTLVPLRAISEAFGCLVDWDGSTRTALIFDLPSDTVLCVGDYPIDDELYSYFAFNTISSYPGITEITEDSQEISEVKSAILDSIAYFCAVKYFSADMGLSIYDPTIIAAVNSSLKQYKESYGDLFGYILASSNMTEKVFTELLYISLFENALIETMQNLAAAIPADEKAAVLMDEVGS